MEYITGIYALNLPCELETSGDWHFSSLDWENYFCRKSEESIFLDYGIFINETLFNNKVYVANHIRALLDLLEMGFFSLAQGMNKDFICNEKYDEEVFSKVSELKFSSVWNEIDEFMSKEYKKKWIDFKKGEKNE